MLKGSPYHIKNAQNPSPILKEIVAQEKAAQKAEANFGAQVREPVTSSRISSAVTQSSRRQPSQVQS